MSCWDRTLSFYKTSGQLASKEKKLDFDPNVISFFSHGEYFVVGGSNKKVQLFSKEGVLLGDIATKNAWVWALAVKPRQNHICCGTDGGSLTMSQVIFSTVHGLYQDRYAFRENLTDVVVQHLLTEQKVRIKCKEYIKKIAVYRDRLAVQLPEKVLIYEIGNTQDSDSMHYTIIQRIQQKFDCSLLVVTSHHIILCQEKKLQLYSFTGTLEREWQLDCVIRYIKVIGGDQQREGLLVGLKNGTVLKIFIDNDFPVMLIKQSTAVRCLDLSCRRKKLAVVDENAQKVSSLLVYDVDESSSTRGKLLYKEENANSVAWNTEMEEMLAFSGNNKLSIKTGDFPPNVQTLQGFVVGFKRSKIYCLHYLSMQTIDVPQSASLYRYIGQTPAGVKLHEKSIDFSTAYRVASLGVTEDDWRFLALMALQNLQMDIAKKAFIRLRDLRHLDLLEDIEQYIKANGKGTNSRDLNDDQLHIVTALVPF